MMVLSNKLTSGNQTNFLSEKKQIFMVVGGRGLPLQVSLAKDVNSNHILFLKH